MSTWELTNLTARLVLPPGVLIVTALIGLALMRSRVRFGAGVVTASLLALYLFSTPVVGGALLRSLQPPYSDPTNDASPGAIVILTAGVLQGAREYGTDVASAPTLERARYGAHLQRRTGKPILVTGGNPGGRHAVTEADATSAVLRELGASVKWTEGASDNTFQSAHRSAEILKEAGVPSVYLVTHAWHMPRARRTFERVGLRVVPAPMAYAAAGDLGLLSFVPSSVALQNTYFFFHEVLGSIVYRLRFDLKR